MSKITRFSRISIFGSSLSASTVAQPEYSSDYIVDRSHFCPVAEAIASQKVSPYSATEQKLYFDFPDGKDTGVKLPVVRMHDVKDLAEISVAVRNETQNVKNTYNKELQAKKDKDYFNSLTSSSTVTATPSAPSAPSKE